MAEESVQKSTGASNLKEKRVSFWHDTKVLISDYVVFFPFAVAAWLIGTGLFSFLFAFYGLFLWMAVPLAFIIATFVFVLCLHFTKAMHTAEINVSAAIYVVLVAIIVFTCIQSRKEAQRRAAANVALPVNGAPPRVEPVAKQ